MNGMIDYDRELISICSRAGLSIESGRGDYDCFVDTFQKIWDGIPDSTPIAFFGRGLAFSHICKAIDVRSKNVVCVIENVKPRFYNDDGIPVTNTDNISDYCFSKVILLSFYHREYMKEELKAYKGEVEIIDVYDILAKEGKNYDKPFFRSAQKDYYDLERLRDAYICSKDTERAGDCLKSLISAYLECRDFLTANIYIDEYLHLGYESGESLRELQFELKALINRIGLRIRSKPNKNIIVFIADAMSYDMSKKAPFLEKLGKSSLVFSNAYSAGFHTIAGVYSMLTGMYHVRDGNFRLDDVTTDDSKFLSKARDFGYKVKYFVPNRDLGRLGIRVGKNFQTELVTTLLWALFKEMANDVEDCVYFIHNLLETHYPFLSGYSGEKLISVEEIAEVINDAGVLSKPELSNKVIRMRNSSLKYWNDQMTYAFQIIDCDDNDIIITSDHGEFSLFFLKLGFMVNDMNRIPMIIKSKHAARGEYGSLFSNLEMASILMNLMQNQKLEFDALPYVRTEIEPAYNNKLALVKDLHWHLYYGQTRLESDDDVYIFCYNGDEGYFIKPNLENNLIAEDGHKERISYYRSQLNLDTREIWKAMFDKYPVLKKKHDANLEKFLQKNLCPFPMQQ